MYVSPKHSQHKPGGQVEFVGRHQQQQQQHHHHHQQQPQHSAPPIQTSTQPNKRTGRAGGSGSRSRAPSHANQSMNWDPNGGGGGGAVNPQPQPTRHRGRGRPPKSAVTHYHQAQTKGSTSGGSASRYQVSSCVALGHLFELFATLWGGERRYNAL